MIGFISLPYQANETAESATVEFGILDGAIGQSVSVSVELSFSDVTAIGRFLQLLNNFLCL